MSRAPFMPFFVDAYIADTMHLTTEQHGAYLLLLMAMWRAGGALQGDDVKLARITRLTPKRWQAARSVVLPFFRRSEDGTLTQKRLKKEWEFVAQKNAQNVINGSIGGKRKALKYNGGAVADATKSAWRKPSEEVASGVAPIPIDNNLPSFTVAEGSEWKPDFPEMPTNLNRLLKTNLMRRTS